MADEQKYRYVPAGSYTIRQEDFGLTLQVEGQCQIVLESSPLQGFYCYVRRCGTGTVNFQTVAGQTIRSESGLTSISAQFAMVTLDRPTTSEWYICGALSA